MKISKHELTPAAIVFGIIIGLPLFVWVITLGGHYTNVVILAITGNEGIAIAGGFLTSLAIFVSPK